MTESLSYRRLNYANVFLNRIRLTLGFPLHCYFELNHEDNILFLNHLIIENIDIFQILNKINESRPIPQNYIE